MNLIDNIMHGAETAFRMNVIGRQVTMNSPDKFQPNRAGEFLLAVKRRKKRPKGD
jgi:hypothetical protein